jgi:uncharacterized protein YcfJ
VNLRLILLVIGLIAGGAIGWTTAPNTSTIKIGPLNMEVQGGDSGDSASITATEENGQVNVKVGSTSPLDDRNTRTLIFAVIGGVVGGAAGFLAGGRKA